ncbi:cobalt ECF transporter T component CbiQ [Myxosarcina sp. GI1]|uniref:cobalt ECF transporter T component CbiQ n=1 Tax=Myxosarcina sp. GI1 TaxID=1541065 RepID=UPI000565123E|nr:cobalt ECF transporter T component CbiQ [Myxosarcina sp. GI1]
MKLVLDRYAYLDSPLHRWQQSYKMVALFGLIFAFAFIQNLALLPAAIIITSIIFKLSKLPFSFLLSRLRYPSWFILAVVILLPFVAGETIIFRWGYLVVREEGCQDALLISVRFFCILTISLVLFGTAPFLDSIKAARSLGLSKIIVDMTLLAYRYLEELGEMLTTMQRAIKLRGFQPKNFNRRNLRIFAQLTGSILIRSYERSLRVYQAMILRGYGNRKAIGNSRKSNITENLYSFWATVITLIIAIFFMTMSIYLPTT